VKVIDVSRSSVDMMSAKVEVKLRKADPITWSDLYLKEVKEEP
jgi:tRNA A37 threonylcarbamoyladenosine dehydratase